MNTIKFIENKASLNKDDNTTLVIINGNILEIPITSSDLMSDPEICFGGLAHKIVLEAKKIGIKVTTEEVLKELLINF
jgi:hypothetical protein